MSLPLRTLLLLTLTLCGLTARALPLVPVVAAENFYGDLAQQLGAPYVQVTSIMQNPDQDPHLFEASATTARALSRASLVIYNGIDYDPWMAKLLAASKAPARQVLIVGTLLGRKTGDNPHLWYDPSSMPVLARAISDQLQRLDPAHRSAYQQNLQQVLTSLQGLNAKVQQLRRTLAGTPVTATEPVFGLMADALGLRMRNARFQLAIMNSTEPSASDIAAFERDLRTRQVRVLLYNNQASSPSASRVKKIAAQAGVPVLGISETMPAGTHYQAWMLSQLQALETTLKH